VVVTKAKNTPAHTSTVQARELAKSMQERFDRMKEQAGGEQLFLEVVAPPAVLPDEAYFPAGPVEDQLDELPAYEPTDPFEYEHFRQPASVPKPNQHEKFE
jgi:hypothetical protein